MRRGGDDAVFVCVFYFFVCSVAWGLEEEEKTASVCAVKVI